MYTNILHYGTTLIFELEKTTVFWKQCNSNSIHTIRDLYKDGVFMSYGDLIQQFSPEDKEHF